MGLETVKFLFLFNNTDSESQMIFTIRIDLHGIFGANCE